MDPDDTTLLDQVRGGDRRALEALLSRHERRVYRFGLEPWRNPVDAEDVVQDTLLAAARGVGELRGASFLLDPAVRQRPELRHRAAAAAGPLDRRGAVARGAAAPDIEDAREPAGAGRRPRSAA